MFVSQSCLGNFFIFLYAALLLRVICWAQENIYSMIESCRAATSDAVWRNNLIMDFIILLFASFFAIHQPKNVIQLEIFQRRFFFSEQIELFAERFLVFWTLWMRIYMRCLHLRSLWNFTIRNKLWLTLNTPPHVPQFLRRALGEQVPTML